LARRERLVIVREVLWLARVLAHRGMPRYLLEEHLQVLHRELGRALPESAASYDGLLQARDELQRERRACIDDVRFFAAGQALEAEIPSELRQRLRGSGVLPVAAVVDEACGITGALQSVETWLGNADQFGTRWAAAVRASIAEAQLRVSRAQVRSATIGVG
jgi:hypothetical protein